MSLLDWSTPAPSFPHLPPATPSPSLTSSASMAAAAAVCPLVHRLYAKSAALRLLFLAQSGGSTLSLLALAFGMLQLCSRQPVPLPVGTLLVLLNLCVALMLANVGALLSALYHLHVPLLRAPATHCYWLSFTLTDCLMIRTILNVALFAVYMSAACLALERMAGSLLLVRRQETRRAIAAFLVIIQWLLSVFAAIPPITAAGPAAGIGSSLLVLPHCAPLTPTPTQTRALFFAVLGLHAFVLAIYSILTYHNHFDPQISRELARHNPVVLEQVHATEQSLPAAATVVALFLLSTFLDRQFLWAVANAFGLSSMRPRASGAEEMFKSALWSELQILAIPLMSLLLVAILQAQIRSQRCAEEDIYERVGGGTGSCGAANVVAVRKVPSAIGGYCCDGDEEDGDGPPARRLSDPYEKSSSVGSSSRSTKSSSTTAGESEEQRKSGKKKESIKPPAKGKQPAIA